MPTRCPLCGLANDDTDLSRHYLSDERLIRFIQATHATWNPTQGGCSRCLEQFHRELNSQSIKGIGPDEKTVVTETTDLIDEPAEKHGACLITIHGADLGKKIELNDGDSILGRSENALIRINEENVSRQHAKIYKRGAEVIIEDLNSTNGTFVNTKKIKSQPLREGDLILIGNTILKFISGSNIENQYHEEIYKLATIDGLTQVYNKSFFLDRLTDELSRSKRYRRELSLILFDFDHFKQLNDTYGHMAGDLVLKKVCSLILKNLRKEDVCGRYGGEEFGILLPETSLGSAMTLAEKLRKMVSDTTFVHKDKTIKTSVSMGVATLNSAIRNPKQLMELADQALYESKKGGRNKVTPAKSD